jgi:hypothetical protein
MYVSSIFRDEGKTSLLTNYIVSLVHQYGNVTYNNISFLESLGDIFGSPEIPLMRFNIGIAIQTPHCPSLFSFLELEPGTVSGHW